MRPRHQWTDEARIEHAERMHEARWLQLMAMTDEDWDAVQDATMTVASLKTGDVLTDEDVVAISKCQEYESWNEECATDAFWRGMAAGRTQAAGKDAADLMAEMDAMKAELAAEKALRAMGSACDEGAQ